MSNIGNMIVEKEDKQDWHEDWETYWDHHSEYAEDGMKEVQMYYGDSLEQSCILN